MSETTEERGTVPRYRCTKALRFGTMNTRCLRNEYHIEPHMGAGIESIPGQRLVWEDGDSREFRSTHEGVLAWFEEAAS